MRRSIPVVLAVLVSLSIGSGAFAAEPPAIDPGASPAVEPNPSPSPEGSAEPSPTPPVDPDPEPTPGPPTDPTPEPSVAPQEPPAGDTPAADEPSQDDGTRAGDEPSADPDLLAAGAPDPTGRYIVMLESDADTARVVAKHAKRDKLKTIRTFGRVVRGFSARLSKAQRSALLADPQVVAVVPDEIIGLAAQTIPNGIRRIGTRSSGVASINGTDDRVDADVAIVDTGIGSHPDLNVAGGYNCSTSDRAAWRDREGHGTHVAGTVGAKDNDFGVVGVAPGVRLWAVKILNNDGFGLLSWYVCGLDWILAQRDPADPSRPRFEAANMSVAKWGRDDGACGAQNDDILHAAICRLVKGGVTVVAAAGNDRGSATKRVPAAYNEVITVSALADTDGKSGALGGKRCYSWGSYDKDDTFADFSNYGFDVDLIAPGKCIYSTRLGPSYGYSSGTSMAAPHVTGAVALYKAGRPRATPAEVRAGLQYLGNLGWRTSTDPDSHHEKLLGVNRLERLGTFSLSATGSALVGESGGTRSVPVTVARSSTFFERVHLTLSNVPSGWSASLTPTSLFGWTANATTLKVVVPSNASGGTHRIRITGSNWGRTDSVEVPIVVEGDRPTARAPIVRPVTSSTVSVSGSVPSSWRLRVAWSAATDPSSAITAYQIEHRVDGGAYGGTKTVGGTARTVDWSGLSLSASHGFRLRARDGAGNWSDWEALATDARFAAVSDRSTAVAYTASFDRGSSGTSTNGVRTTSSSGGAIARYTFTGRGIAVIAPRNSNRGKVHVYLNGVFKATVDTRASSYQARRVIYQGMYTTSGTRTITLKVAGTAGRPTFSLDGFIVVK